MELVKVYPQVIDGLVSQWYRPCLAAFAHQVNMRGLNERDIPSSISGL